MPRDTAVAGVLAPTAHWPVALIRLAAVWTALLALTWLEWREMGHQWWDIDTYNHILLVPPIIAWLVWLRRTELARIRPAGWLPGIAWLLAGLTLWLFGSRAEINLVSQLGTLLAFQGALLALLGIRAGLVLAFPLGYALFLVPFGDELIPSLQQVTAKIAVGLTHLSGVPAIIDGLYIDTPGGRFVVAEECSGVKFLVAMVALATLVAWTGLAGWHRRIALIVGAAAVSVLANGVRAWGTIFVAQYVGAERAGGFDHIVYGWLFFALVIGAVLGIAWRFLEREPHQAGLSAEQASTHPLAKLASSEIDAAQALLGVAIAVVGFAAFAALG